MARENKATVAAVISNQEILAEINLISQIQQIETRFATEPDSIRFAQLADAYLGIGDFEHAIKLCEQGLVKHPQYDTGTLVLAKSHYLSGNKKKAREVLQDFLITHPASLSGHKLLGDLSLEEDDVAGTVSHYRIALRFDPINRQIIQTLVDLKDKYQKIKESKPSDEEEEEVVKTVAKKAEPTVPPDTQVKKTSPVSEEKPAVKPAPDKEDNKLDSFIEDAIQPMEDRVEFKPIEVKPAKTEPVIAKTQEKPKAEEKPSEFSPAYTDNNGIMYFYDDDEVSFEQYKKRLDLQKAGKALILERALLDQKLAEKGIKTAVKTRKAEDDAFAAQAESAIDMEITPKGFEFEAEKEKPKKIATFEEHIDASMAKEEEDLLTAAEQEAALSEIEMSYKDYLDILTNEEDLLEALFQEEHEAGIEEEKEDKAGRILATAEDSEKPLSSTTEADQPIPYLDYVQSLESDSDITEASFTTQSAVTEKEETIGFSEFSSYLDDSDDTIDYASYAMLLEVEGSSAKTLWADVPATVESAVSYNDYIVSAPAAEKAYAVFKTPDEDKKQEKAKEVSAADAVVEATVTGAKTVVESVVKAEAAKTIQPEIKEEITEETDDYQEEEFETEINPQDATPELVEKLAARGQYGSAYKVCKMLKVKNPTDAKVDRKILELKRLYVWSSQMVG
ncbi:hypothetical protein F9K33_03855 [bacterium]|nr:MAG: hypothetical protein F9K33_03855 [bacterium]